MPSSTVAETTSAAIHVSSATRRSGLYAQMALTVSRSAGGAERRSSVAGSIGMRMVSAAPRTAPEISTRMAVSGPSSGANTLTVAGPRLPAKPYVSPSRLDRRRRTVATRSSGSRLLSPPVRIGPHSPAATTSAATSGSGKRPRRSTAAANNTAYVVPAAAMTHRGSRARSTRRADSGPRRCGAVSAAPSRPAVLIGSSMSVRAVQTSTRPTVAPASTRRSSNAARK